MSKTHSLTIMVLSDSVGGTAGNVVSAAMAQFPDVAYEMKNFPFIQEEDQLYTVLEKANNFKAIVLHTFVDTLLVEIIETYCSEHGIACIDVINPLIREVTAKTNTMPQHKPGANHKLDAKYFDRISALEFAVKYDDGKDPKGFLEADIVILGISRTSKTPLSIYMANQGYKVANLPLMPESRIPDELWKVDTKRLVGLTNEEEMLSNIRRERMISYGMDPETAYSSKERIRREIEFAEDLYKKLNCQIINVSSKSIEETSAIIIDSLNND
ncbi:pyruvate, water dikinase regulatory protein [Alkalibacterium kapii]|uniref:Putative pyruvate, phosphate dikinase regulatory protein n=1 Tax=Alkalibacterium kapii TaxID=426704 RepID=A0A511ARD1_9LACT|nr:pyruvate, water dikinase regulatory protein [Alkalibacterium kapii]GEK90646.1 putative pyruvate, phosphate dikinase regulatory protein [Alkalibacterium kapii]